MVNTRAKGHESVIQFWLPDPDDIERVLQLLEICGYTDKCMARDEAATSGESTEVFEVTIKRRAISIPQTWREEVKWVKDLVEGTWHA